VDHEERYVYAYVEKGIGGARHAIIYVFTGFEKASQMANNNAEEVAKSLLPNTRVLAANHTGRLSCG